MTKSFPYKPIHLLLGASSGSARDIVAQAMVPALSERLHQPINIDLHQGENGVAAARFVANSNADGHTLFMTCLGIHAVGPSLQPPPPYDVIDDFSPISLIARCPLLLAVHPSVAVHSVSELTKFAQKHPAALTYGSSSIGGAPDLAAELYKKIAAVDLKLICYDSTRKLYADLIAGKISLSFNNIMSMLEPLAADHLRGIAVTGAGRCPLLPDLPTVAEAGVPGYELTNWLGIVGPARMDPEIINILSEAIAGALNELSVKQHLEASGMEIAATSGSEFSRFIRSELTKWTPIVNDYMARSTPQL